ncbi:MAG: SGNH/GDSL hydrolase family protein [Pirellulales bacterium]
MTTRSKKPLRWWGKLLLVGLSLAFCGGVLEVALRISGVSIPTATVLGTFFQYDPQTGWSGQPLARGHFQTINFSVDVTHDADGLRSSGLSTRLADDRDSTERVCWILGDSTAWGWGVADDEHYAALLNRDQPAHLRFRTLGVPGFSNVQQYYRLRDLLARGYRPEVVLLCFNINDHSDNFALVDNDPPRPHWQLPNGQLTLFEPPMARSFEFEVGSFLRRNSLAVSFLSYHAQRARHVWRQRRSAAQQAASSAAPAPTGDTEPSPAEAPQVAAVPAAPANLRPDLPPQTLEGLKIILQRIRELCREHDVEFAVASDFHPDELLTTACRELDLPLLDTTQRYQRFLRSSDGGQAVFFNHDPHPTALGHRLFAEALREELHRWHPEWRVLPGSRELARQTTDDAETTVVR